MLRIINDSGNGVFTKFVNAETGEDLSKLLAISYGATITIGPVVTAKLEPCILSADVTINHAEWLTKHPITGQFEPLAAMEFRDGSRVEFAEDGTPQLVAPMNR